MFKLVAYVDPLQLHSTPFILAIRSYVLVVQTVSIVC